MGSGAGRIVLLRGGATEGPEGRLLGRGNDRLSTLGQVQAQKAAELLMDLEVRNCLPAHIPPSREGEHKAPGDILFNLSCKLWSRPCTTWT